MLHMPEKYINPNARVLHIADGFKDTDGERFFGVLEHITTEGDYIINHPSKNFTCVLYFDWFNEDAQAYMKQNFRLDMRLECAMDENGRIMSFYEETK